MVSGNFFFPRPGLGPAADLLSFASPKERKQRKGDPAVCVPSLRYGQPAVLTFRGVSPKLASLKQGRALIRETLRSSAQPEGLGRPTRHRYARRLNALRAFASLGRGALTPTLSQREREPIQAERSKGSIASRARRWPVRLPLPSGCAEERSVSRIRARSCLSEASSARPRETRAPQVARSAAKGRRQWGRLFFGYFLLAKQKKVARPPGRDPASENKPIQGKKEC